MGGEEEREQSAEERGDVKGGPCPAPALEAVEVEAPAALV